MRLLLGLGVAICALATSCRKPPAPSPPIPIAVDVSGCLPRRCELDDSRTLRFVLPTSAPPVAIASDRGPIVGERTSLGTELRFTFKVPEGARVITLTALANGSTPSFRLELAAPADPPEVVKARALRAEGKGSEAGTLLETWVKTATGEGRVRALGLLARIELARGASGDAIRHLRESLDLGGPSDDAFALAHALVHGPRAFDQARAAIERLGPLDDHPDGRARRAYYLGEIAFETGDVRTAMQSFRASRAAATRLGMRRLAHLSQQYLAIALQIGGRNEEAKALVDSVLADPDLQPCERADALTDLGWIALLGHESGGKIDPVPPTEQALAIVRASCKDARSEANLLVNLALSELQADAPKRARARLAEARAVWGKDAPSTVALWGLEIDARTSLGSGDTKGALATFERLSALAEASSSSELAWRAAVGAGEAHEAAGAREAALVDYARAETILDGRSLDVPHGDGRDGFLGERSRSARLRVDLLLRMGRAADALAAARSARTRGIAAVARSGVLSSLDPAARARWERAVSAIRAERDAIDREAASDWTLAQDQLAAVQVARKAREARAKAAIDEALAVLGRSGKPTTPRPLGEGDLVLAFHPIRKGFAVFAADAAGVRVEKMETVEPTTLLAPFEEKLAAARRVRVLPYGATHAIDVHALDFHGAPLVAHVPVSYSLDLPFTDAAPASASLLLVADPASDLPAARLEAKEVAARHHGPLQTLLGEEAAAVSVRAALPKVDRFHYAGHGNAAGEAGWESVLPLAHGSLSVADILSLPRAPSLVILSACEAARTTARGEGLGIAQAFVLAGSLGVIAATRDVPDVSALALAHALYGNVLPYPETDAATLLQTAQLAMRTSAVTEWAAFRALTP